MIRLLTILLLISLNSFATTYYVSPSGSDSNDGLTPSTSWRTVAKVNAFTFAANDIIRFQKDGVWNETLRASRNDLTFTWYGSGSSYPIISGEASLTSWTSTGTNKWRASVPWADSTLTMVTISGVTQPFARDSAGWKRYTAVSSNTISYPHLSNWVGKTIVIKSDEWTITRGVITNDNGTNITFRKWFDLSNGSAPGLGATKSNYGFFLFNDTSYLRTQNDVVFNQTAKQIYVYSASTPTNVKTTNLDTLFNANSKTNITIRGIRFRYAGLYAVYGSFTTNLNIDSCTFEYMGAQAIGAYRATGITVQNCTIDQCLQTAIYIQNVTSPYINASVLNNYVTNVGLLFGMGSFGQNPDYSALGISSFTGLRCYNNYISNVGDAGIKFGGNIADIAYNNVSFVTLKTADRGCVYNFMEIDVVTDTGYRKVVRNNFLSNTYGNLEGTPQEFSSNPTIRSIGVYLDGRNEGDSVYGNVLWNITGGAFSFNIDSNVYCADNLVVMSDSTSRLKTAKGLNMQQLRNYPIRDFVFTNNIVYASLSTQKQLVYTAGSQSAASIIGNFKAVGTINNNYYNLPSIANYMTIAGTPYAEANYNHTQYTSTFGFGVSDIILPNYSLPQCLFLKNWSANPSTTYFTGKSYINAQGTIFRDSARLQAYTGQLLFPTAVTPIVVTIDSNPVITLPVNSTTISGSAVGGSGITYQWVKLTGTGGTITSPSSASTTVTGLSAGTYTYQLIATNSQSQKDTGYATVTVNPAPPPANVPPVVTITPNTLEITLPTNSVSLNGSATDSDGTVVSYLWTKVSGTGGSISTPTTPVTTVTGLTEGVYIYSLTATDNVGATGSATVQVKVNAAPPPSTTPRIRIKKG